MRFIWRLLKFSILLSPVALAVLAAVQRANLLRDGAFWPLLVLFVSLGVWGALTTASERTPGQFWLSGLRAFVPRRDLLHHEAMAAIARADNSIKILDTYWGDVDSYRFALSKALTSSATCKVRVLLAQQHGHLAAIRDAAVPGTLNVNANLPATLSRLVAFKKSLREDISLADRLEIRQFDAIVPGPMILVDKRHLFVGTFLQHGSGSPATPAMWIEAGWLRKSPIVEAYESTFDAIWTGPASSPLKLADV